VLQRHTIDATTAAEVLTRARAVQAGFFTAGLFLQLPRHRTEPRLDPAVVERLRGLASPAAAAAVTLWRATGIGVDELRGLRLGDLHDTGPDQHLAVGATLYRVPARGAGLLRAAVIERRTQLAQNPSDAMSTPRRGPTCSPERRRAVLPRGGRSCGSSSALPHVPASRRCRRRSPEPRSPTYAARRDQGRP